MIQLSHFWLFIQRIKKNNWKRNMHSYVHCSIIYNSQCMDKEDMRYRCVCVCVHVHARSVVSSSLQHHGLQPAMLLCLWDYPGRNTGVDCHALLQGIFLSQGLNPHLLHWQVDSLPLRHEGSPYTDNGILLSHKKNEILSFAITWMYLKGIILSEISQIKKK